MPTTEQNYEKFLETFKWACDRIINFQEEEKADQEDDSICAWYDMMDREGRNTGD